MNNFITDDVMKSYGVFDRCPLTGLIASAGGDDCIQVFAEDSSSQDAEEQPSFNLVAKAETFEVNGLSWNPCVNGLLASCSDDGSVKLWNITGCSQLVLP